MAWHASRANSTMDGRARAGNIIRAASMRRSGGHCSAPAAHQHVAIAQAGPRLRTAHASAPGHVPSRLSKGSREAKVVARGLPTTRPAV